MDGSLLVCDEPGRRELDWRLHPKGAVRRLLVVMSDPRLPLPRHVFQHFEVRLVHVIPLEAAEEGLWCEEEHPTNRSVLIPLSKRRGSPQTIYVCKHAREKNFKDFCPSLELVRHNSQVKESFRGLWAWGGWGETSGPRLDPLLRL